MDQVCQYEAGCGGMWQGVGACGRVLGHVAVSEVVAGGQAYSIDGDMWQGWDSVVGCEGMWPGWWQGVGACSRGWGIWQV